MKWEHFTWLLVDNADKYFFIAGPVFFIFYILLKNKISYRKIQSKFPRLPDYGREIFFSTLSVIIFSFPPLFLLYVDSIRPHTTFYRNISDYGWLYFFACFCIMIFLHDTYFYWMHRLIHHPKLFRTFHLVHHKSHNPSPWAAYAFHPLEAILESFIFVIFLFTIPVHTWHLKGFFIFSLFYNVYGHLGFELYPKGFNKHWLGKWLNTSVAHNMHHKYYKGNYGLYFLIWDRLMGTLNQNYDRAFEGVTTKTKEIIPTVERQPGKEETLPAIVSNPNKI